MIEKKKMNEKQMTFKGQIVDCSDYQLRDDLTGEVKRISGRKNVQRILQNYLDCYIVGENTYLYR